VLSVDIGAGHRMAAEALCQGIAEERPGSEHKILEALEYTGPDGGKLAKDLYFGALKEAPDLWGTLYKQKGLFELFRPINELADDFRLGKLAPEARAFRPDVVLAMHPIACGLASSLARKREVECPVVAVLTDFDAHPAWIYEGIALYLVASAAMEHDLRARRPPSGEVVATGLPIRLPFGRCRDDTTARRRLGLDERRFTVLLLGGGLGLGPIAETAEALVGPNSPVQLVVIAGKNQELERSARALAARTTVPVHVTGLVENVWDYMSAADVAIGKPGGMTCAELLAAGVPLVALAPIPGQEQANCDTLVRAGTALHAPTALAACAIVQDLYARPQVLATMRRAARDLGRPDAAREAASRVIGLVDERARPRLRVRIADPSVPRAGGARADQSIDDELAALKRKLGIKG
jgi:processive 1,2-diacylglycerol beta-glucosyltransferase